MVKPPHFSSLREHYPYKPGVSMSIPAGAVAKGNKDLVEAIGGQLHRSLAAVYPDLNLMNTCAVRLSYCLNRAGHKIAPARGVRTFRGDDGYLYTISADEMIAYMRSQFGEPQKIWDGRKSAAHRWLGTVTPPLQGLFGYDWQGRIADFGAGGHVDIGKLINTASMAMVEIGTGAYYNTGAMAVFFWACT